MIPLVDRKMKGKGTILAETILNQGRNVIVVGEVQSAFRADGSDRKNPPMASGAIPFFHYWPLLTRPEKIGNPITNARGAFLIGGTGNLQIGSLVSREMWNLL